MMHDIPVSPSFSSTPPGDAGGAKTDAAISGDAVQEEEGPPPSPRVLLYCYCCDLEKFAAAGLLRLQA